MSFTNGRDKRSIAIKIITANSSARRSGVGIREAQHLLESETRTNNLILFDGLQNYGLQPIPKAINPGIGWQPFFVHTEAMPTLGIDM